jgi:polyisoprenoid-binding protein YceI
MKGLLFFALCFMFSAGVQAAEYVIDYENSTMKFFGQHAGSQFEGEFKKWNAKIIFDPENLTESKFEAEIDLASATTGNSMYDGTLPKSDWFDVENYPKANFQSSDFEKVGEDEYVAKGYLNIKDKANHVDLKFSLSPADLSSEVISGKGDFTLDRLAYDIGKKSDPDVEWVSKEIDVKLDLKVSKK